MNESITIEFRRNGSKLPITRFSSTDGIVLGSETSAWPLALAIGILPNNPVTAHRMDLVRQRLNWQKPRFLFNATLTGGTLRLSGVDSKALPPGAYRLSVELKGIKLLGNQAEIDVPPNGSALLAVSLAPETHRLEFAPEMIPDGDVAGLALAHPNSIIDEQPALNWLATSGARIQRKACLLNILAALRCTPSVGDPLCASVQSFFFADVDRVYAALNGDFRARLLATPNVYREGTPGAAIHRRLLNRIPSRSASDFTLESFRVGEFNSLQFCLALPQNPSDDPTIYADIDIDLGNPLASIGGFIVHLGELLDPGQTDHLALYSKLCTRPGFSDFLFYRLARAAHP
jgi:hypothetical protein